MLARVLPALRPACLASRRLRGLSPICCSESPGARDPADLPALLVGHQQERPAQRPLQDGVLDRALEIGDHVRDLGPVGDVVTEEDHPAAFPSRISSKSASGGSRPW